ncbi:MAG TPA: ABC transporter permease [Baekduia sp.]|nr:ABC transporter permease [Baekduia sp.]
MSTVAAPVRRFRWPSAARWRAIAANGTVMSAITFVVLLAIWTYYLPGGLTAFQLNNLLGLTIALAFAGFGTTLVIISGGFDLSVAGVVSLANVWVATKMQDSTGSVIGVVVVVSLIGLATGLVNGFLVGFLGLESIAATLSTYIMLTGFALVLLAAPGGVVPTTFSDPLTALLGDTVPVALLVLIGLALVWLVLRRTRFGVNLFAVGADESAAEMSGVRVRSVKLATYGLAGLMYALAGLYYSAEVGTGDPNSGAPFLLTAFATVALGGASFAGGRGSAIGTIFGAGVLTLIPKVLFVLGVASFYTSVVQGVVLIAAVLLAILTARLVQR